MYSTFQCPKSHLDMWIWTFMMKTRDISKIISKSQKLGPSLTYFPPFWMLLLFNCSDYIFVPRVAEKNPNTHSQRKIWKRREGRSWEAENPLGSWEETFKHVLSCRVLTGTAGLAAASASSPASKLSAHLCSSAKGLGYVSQHPFFFRIPLWPAGLPGRFWMQCMDVGSQLFGVLWLYLVWSGVRTSLGTCGSPKGPLRHDVHMHHDVYTHVMWLPFLLVSLSRFNVFRGWKQEGLDVPSKIKDHNDLKDTEAGKFHGLFQHFATMPHCGRQGWLASLSSPSLLRALLHPA